MYAFSAKTYLTRTSQFYNRVKLKSKSGTPLSELKFKLVPKAIELPPGCDPDATNVEETYRVCFYSVYGKMPGKVFVRNSKLIIQNADECRCSLMTFILAVMVAHQETSPERQFTPEMLSRQNAIRHVEAYRNACAFRYGTFDTSSFSMLTGKDLEPLETALFLSETSFAEYLVGCHSAGVEFPTKAFFSERELSVQPPWCATEPVYISGVVVPWLNGASGSTKVVSRHRHNVVQMVKHLKHSPGDARVVFRAREKVVKRVLDKIMTGRQQIFSDTTTISSMSEFWTELGRHL